MESASNLYEPVVARQGLEFSEITEYSRTKKEVLKQVLLSKLWVKSFPTRRVDPKDQIAVVLLVALVAC